MLCEGRRVWSWRWVVGVLGCGAAAPPPGPGESPLLTFFRGSSPVFSILMWRGRPLSPVCWDCFWNGPWRLCGLLTGRAAGQTSRPRGRGTLGFPRRTCSRARAALGSCVCHGATQPARSPRPQSRRRAGDSGPSRPRLRGAQRPPEATPHHQLSPSSPLGERPLG